VRRKQNDMVKLNKRAEVQIEPPPYNVRVAGKEGEVGLVEAPVVRVGPYHEEIISLQRDPD
jgi:hypothetical protein